MRVECKIEPIYEIADSRTTMGPKGDADDGGKITSFFKPRPKVDHDDRPALAEKPNKVSNKRKFEADPSVTEVKEKLQKLGSEVAELVSGMGPSWLEALEQELAKPYFTSLRYRCTL